MHHLAQFIAAKRFFDNFSAITVIIMVIQLAHRLCSLIPYDCERARRILLHELVIEVLPIKKLVGFLEAIRSLVCVI